MGNLVGKQHHGTYRQYHDGQNRPEDNLQRFFHMLLISYQQLPGRAGLCILFGLQLVSKSCSFIENE
jgi:hypothetical protein